jgi:L-ascorbate metabolism protein UlaG (beta-lactamase superfamily)
MNALIPNLLKDKALLADIHEAALDIRRFHLWWLGQSGFLLQWRARHALIDPYLSDSLSEKYAATDKPHIRMSERAIAPERLNFIDLATSSHNHTDHLDGATLIPLLRANPHIAFICPEANRDFAVERLGCPPDFPIGLDAGQLVEIAGFRVHGVPAAHNELERDAQGRCRFMGYVFQFGPWTVYHSGDTLWHEAILEALAPFSIDVALLPINGNKPERRVAGNLDAREAASLARRIGAGVVIPCHYDMFAFNTADPGDLAREAERIGQPHVVLRGGERWSSPPAP